MFQLTPMPPFSLSSELNTLSAKLKPEAGIMALACQELVRYPSFKLLIVGDAGTGKTTFVNRHRMGERLKKKDPNIHVVVHPMDFRTDYGQMMFYCWDTDGLEAELFRGDWGQPERKFYESPSCAIIMFDVTSRGTYDNVPEWYRIIRRVDERIPIVICGNKVDDVKNRQVKPEDITFLLKKNLPYYEISAKGSYNFEKPFFYLARWMARKVTRFVRSPPLAPPEVEIDLEAQNKIEQELAAPACCC